MRLIIDIPEDEYRKIALCKEVDVLNGGIYDAILNGIILSEEYRELIDKRDINLFSPLMGLDEVIRDLIVDHELTDINGYDEVNIAYFAEDLLQKAQNVIDTAPTVLEANYGGRTNADCS